MEKQVSSKLVKRLKIQDYCGMSDKRLSELAFGNRFAYILCSFLVFIGVVLANIPLLCAMMLIALYGVLLPYHPFDYIYNHGLRKVLNKPELPPRSLQIKFACSIATIWLAIAIGLFFLDFMTAGYICGGILFSLAFTVSTTDICILSLLYNYLFRVKI